jgi:hypothetical protein
MAKFLDTQAISNELMKLIKEAKEKIILVSYSFKVNPQIQERLKAKSAHGHLSEIIIVYGKTQLQPTELSWMKGIKDLKIYEKSNLHAKCYLNENKAIICSMNLYDYSQQNNIEMGMLITKSEDKEAYEELIDEINNIKVNAVTKSISELESSALGNIYQVNLPQKTNLAKTQEKLQITKTEMRPEQKLISKVLKKWRLARSKEEKTLSFHILTDQEILNLSSSDIIEKSTIFEIIPEKKAIKYGDLILAEIKNTSRYTIGQIVAVDPRYKRVKLKLYETGEERWYDTNFELPQKDKLVAVWLHENWFNDWMYLG